MFEFVAFETIYVGKNEIYSKESPKIFLIHRHALMSFGSFPRIKIPYRRQIVCLTPAISEVQIQIAVRNQRFHRLIFQNAIRKLV